MEANISVKHLMNTIYKLKAYDLVLDAMSLLYLYMVHSNSMIILCWCVCMCVFMAQMECIFSCWQPVQRRWRQVWNRAQDWRPKRWDLIKNGTIADSRHMVIDTHTHTHSYPHSVKAHSDTSYKHLIQLLLMHTSDMPDVILSYLQTLTDGYQTEIQL